MKNLSMLICEALRDLVAYVQSKKREKHPWKSVNFSFKPATFLKLTLLHGCFLRFLNCTNRPNRAMHQSALNHVFDASEIWTFCGPFISGYKQNLGTEG